MGGDQRRLRRRPLSTIGSLPPPMGERPRRGRGLPGVGCGSRVCGAAGQLGAPPQAAALPRPCVRSPSVGTEHPRARAFLASYSQAPRVDAAGWSGLQGRQRPRRTFPSVRFEGLARSARSWRKETNHPSFLFPDTMFNTERSDRFWSESSQVGDLAAGLKGVSSGERFSGRVKGAHPREGIRPGPESPRVALCFAYPAQLTTWIQQP